MIRSLVLRLWQPIAVWAVLQALLAGATLAVKFAGKDRANGHARR